MKVEWDLKKLAELVNVYNGNSINEKVKKEKYLGVEKGVPYIGTKDVSFESEITYDNGVRIPDSELGNFKTAPKNSVLICAEGGSAGKKIGFTEKEVCFGNKLFALTAKNGVEIKYIYYFLFSDLFISCFNEAKTGVIGGVSIKKFKNILIPIPSSEEQKRIVAKLDKIFSSLVILKSNNIKNKIYAANIIESFMDSQFNESGTGRRQMKLGDAIKLEYGKPLPANLRKTDGLYPVYGANGIKTRSDKYHYDKYSIIVGRKGSAGEVTLTESKFWPLDVTYYVTFDQSKYDLKFIYYLLIHSKLPTLAKGIKPGINRNDAYNIRVAIPDLVEQKKIVSKLDKIKSETESLQNIYNTKLAELDKLKRSVLNDIYDSSIALRAGL